MANEIEFSFLEPQDLMTKTTYDSNEDNVVEVAQDIEGFSSAADNTFYGKVGGVTGFYTVPAGAQAINDLTDVDTTGISIGQVLQYDGTNFVPFTITDQVGATILDELGDVDTTTTAPTNGDTLVFDGTNFVPQAPSGGGASVISDLTDVDTTGVALNNVLKYDGTNWVDGSVAYSEVTGTPTLATVATTGAYSDLTGTPTLATVATTGSYTDLLDQPTIPTNINDLGDVDISGITSGQVLQYNGTSFVAATISGGGASALDDLSDVDTTTTAPTNGDALVFDGTNFVPQAVSGSGATNLNELTDVDTTGAITDNVLKFDGTNWVDGSVSYSELTGTPTLAVVATSGDYNDLSNLPSIPANVNDLGDVDTTGVVTNNVLKYNGTTWVDGSVDYSEVSGTPTLAPVATSGAYSDLTGTPTLATVATTGSYDDLTNLPVLATVATSGSYTDLANTPSIPSEINDLTDVNTTGITTGQVLQFDGTSFVPATISGGGASALDDLSDVDTTTTAPTSGDALVYDGTNFVPQAISGGSSTFSYEWVELWYTSGAGGDLSAPDAIQNETSGVTTTITDGPGGIVEFTFTGKAYPPISIQQYAHVTTTNEYILMTPVTGTRKVSGGGATYDQTTLFSGSFNNVITLDCAMGQVGASAGLGQRARLYIMFAFGE
jgi:hypothetical protein